MKRRIALPVFSLFCLALTMKAHADWLTVNSIPAAAVVKVDGKEAGSTPLRLQGKSGESIILEVGGDTLKTIRMEHLFAGNRIVYLDLVEGIEIDEDTFWQKQTAEIPNSAKPEPPKETAPPEPAPAETETVSTGPDESAPQEQPETTEVAPEESAPEPSMDDSIAGSAQEVQNEGLRQAPLAGPTTAMIDQIPEPDNLPAITDTVASTGDVILDLGIRNNGIVKDVVFVTEIQDAGLKDYMTAWAMKWTFQPAKESGNPIESRMKIKLEYDLTAGEFRFPSYEMVRRVKQDAQEIVDGTAESPQQQIEIVEPAEPVSDETYYSAAEVDEKAMVFSPPNMGNIPLEIINLNLKGNARFAIFIRPDGSVSRVTITQSTGSPKLDDYIIPMIMKSFWEPAKKSGNPVGFTRELSLEFYTTACKFQFSDLDE